MVLQVSLFTQWFVLLNFLLVFLFDKDAFLACMYVLAQRQIKKCQAKGLFASFFFFFPFS